MRASRVDPSLVYLSDYRDDTHAAFCSLIWVVWRVYDGVYNMEHMDGWSVLIKEGKFIKRNYKWEKHEIIKWNKCNSLGSVNKLISYYISSNSYDSVIENIL